MRYPLLAPLVAAALLGCGTDPQPASPLDAGLDAGAMDVPPADVPAVDVQRSSPDVPLPTECNDVEIEDLVELGTLDGEVTRLTGDNRGLRNSNTLGLQPPAAFNSQCGFRTTYQRVFRYVMRRAGSLRVSTANPGTAATLDTTLSVLAMRACVANPRDFFCNNDDPTATAASRNRFASRVATAALPAGAVVHIAVGGLASTTALPGRVVQGAFELTVEEVAPIAEGARCDRRQLSGACAPGLTCVGPTPGAVEGSCRRAGTAPGTPCASDACEAGLSCDTSTNLCFRAQPPGMPCEAGASAWNRCSPDASCVTQPGAVGVCRARGTVANAACAPGDRCTGEGLTCDGPAGACRVTVARGGECNLADSACPSGQACHFAHGAQSVGRCTDAATVPGMACAAGNACTGAGLTCNTGVTPARCNGAAAAPGEVCTAFVPCVTGNVCFLTDPTDRTRGRCFTDGLEAGRCRATGAACNAGLVCTNAATPASGRCVRVATVAEPCELFSSGVICATGTTCARDGASPTAGRCRADGSAPGAACRAAAPRCDGELRCSAASGAGVCQGAGESGACDPRTLSLGCASGQVCHATGFNTGRCATPTAEVEPNDRVSLAQSLPGASSSVRGSLSSGDLDCVSVEATAGARLVARVAGANGLCPSTSLVLDLFDPDGRLLTTANANGPFACPLIDGTLADSPAFSVARDLRAGRYTVCERSASNSDVGETVLDVEVVPAP
ncbi:MAG: hypothetical protein EPO40_20005 [Myxococcaceae bacterium]|nr:MAG: hypothetical protein EPO40_20005 [Myxococcaceae bacterium]